MLNIDMNKMFDSRLFSEELSKESCYCDLSYLGAARDSYAINEKSEAHAFADEMQISSNTSVSDLKMFYESLVKVDSVRSHVILFNSPGDNDRSAKVLGDFARMVSGIDNNRILLVDCNLQNPGLHRNFNLPPEQGWTDYVNNHAAAVDIVKETALRNVYLLQSNNAAVNRLKMLMSPEFKELIDALKHKFDFILLNSAPYRQCIDAFVLAKFLRPIVLLLPGQTGSHSEDVSDVYDELTVLKLDIFELVATYPR